jgi:hypothetical protein
MYRIDNRYASTTLPTPASQGPGGFFTGGDPTTGQSATIVDADFLNAVQEELINIVTRGGLTPDKTNRTQLLLALSNLFTGAWQNITATQDLLVPSWATQFAFELSGAGGGGAYCQANGGLYQSGAGGGAGGAAQGQRAVSPGELIHVIIGAGGPSDQAGGSSSLAYGSDWTVTATGGQPGLWHDGGSGCAGGQGGIAYGADGDILIAASYGDDGQTGTYITAGNGGAGLWGGAGRAGYTAGIAAGGPGSGGGGAYDSNANGNVRYNGGSGSNGILRYRFMP